MWIWIINKESNNCFFSPFDDGACHNKLNRHSVYQHVWLISSMIFTSYTLHILTVLFLLLFQFLFFFLFFFLCRRQCCCTCQCWYSFFFFCWLFIYIQVLHTSSAMTTTTTTKYFHFIVGQNHFKHPHVMLP